MRSKFIVAIAIAMLPLAAPSALGAPMSTSTLLTGEPAVTSVWAKCYRVCHAYGYCGYGYHKHRCCKYWKRVCH
jgi:hypothetical protein